MKKILIIAANGLNKTGVPGVIMNIVRNFNNLYNFDIVVFEKKNTYYEEEFKSFGGTIFYIKNHQQNKNWFMSKLDYAFSRKRIFKKACEIMKNNNYYAIHCFNELESVPFLKAGKKCKIAKRIIHNNQSVVFNKTFLHRIWKKHLKKQIYKYSTDRISVANHSGQTIFLNNDFITIHNTYNEKLFHFSKTNFNDDIIRLVQVGTYSSKKNQMFSIHLCDSLGKSGHTTQLSFVGFEDEPGYLKKLQDEINRLNLQQHVEFLPFDTDLPHLFSTKQILLLPSKKEAFPLVLLEAQASGLYCVASNSSPSECNAGGCVFLDLINDEWVNSIIKIAKSNPNHKKFNMELFSNYTFINKINDVYD